MRYAIAALWVFQGLGDDRVPAPLVRTTGPLLRHLMLLFLPSIAGMAVHFGRLADE